MRHGQHMCMCPYLQGLLNLFIHGGYSTIESGFMNPEFGVSDKLHSINESESRFGFGESSFTCNVTSAMSANDYK